MKILVNSVYCSTCNVHKYAIITWGQRTFHSGVWPKPFKFQEAAFSASQTHMFSVAVAESYSVTRNHGERNKK